MHPADLETLQRVGTYAHVYGLGGYEISPEPTHWLKEGEKLSFGNIQLEVLFTPGHAPGHVVFYNRENQFVINGDVLFDGGFGRVDLTGGDLNALKKSITEILFALPDETVVYCGHGSTTTIGKEKQTNPILMY
jgi:glyoxylase-like metal-dependent hydrolase (beta-lactamase superfamily II)